MTYTRIDDNPDSPTYGKVTVLDEFGNDMSKMFWYRGELRVTAQLLDDSLPINDEILYEYRQVLLDRRDGPRLGPGRGEWQRYKRKPIVTEKHWGPDKVPRRREEWDPWD